ncbi:hypothetical protein [Cereibacter changlensis]|nr:hypothetical protein [Cereibacter changlensis]
MSVSTYPCARRNAAPAWPIPPFAKAMIGVLLRVTFVPVLTQLPVTLLGP